MDRRDLLKSLALLGISATTVTAEEHKHVGGKSKFKGPVKKDPLHFCGIHTAKNNPSFQIITQHYCVSHGKDMHQCLLYDSFEPDAKLLGVEYIVTDEVYKGLSDSEKKYWHPHTYEVLGGGLIAPSMSSGDEMKFMKALIKTWGKTWHTWPDPSTPVPLGEPLLMWSLMADDQVDKAVVEKRDKIFGTKTEKIREKRVKEIGLEVPKVRGPRNVDDIGRQWTSSGEDVPTPIKK